MTTQPSILIIEKETALRPYLFEHLEERGWTVYRSGFGAEALLMAKQHIPSVILLDTGAELANATDLALELKKDVITCSIPIIALTSAEQHTYQADSQWAAEVITALDSIPTLMAKIYHLIAKQKIKKPYVLVVDDEPDIVDITTAELMRAGFIASGASNGAEALDVVRKVQPDDILLDLEMPLLNGWEFLNQVRKEMADLRLPIVILTGTDRRIEDRQEALALGAYDYLLKPCEPSEIIEAIQKAMLKAKEDAEE
jgi:DNA-binding response OmpR family regulator